MAFFSHFKYIINKSAICLELLLLITSSCGELLTGLWLLYMINICVSATKQYNQMILLIYSCNNIQM